MSFTAAEWLDAMAESKHSAIAEQFDRLMRENAAALSRLASGYVNSISDRDDLVQEIALALWRALPRFREECSLRTFLFRIAHNRAVAWLAHRNKFVQADEGEMLVRDPRPNPEDGYVRAQRNQLLFKAIRGLPISYRQVMMLVLEGFDYREISQVLGITENNTAVRLNRAKQLLKKALDEAL